MLSPFLCVLCWLGASKRKQPSATKNVFHSLSFTVSDDFCQADLSLTLSAPSLCGKFSMGNIPGDNRNFYNLKKWKNPFLRPGRFSSTLLVGFLLFLLQSLYAGAGKVFSYSHMFQINIVTFTEAIIILVMHHTSEYLICPQPEVRTPKVFFFFPTLCNCNSV